ncbi:MAG: phage tail protein, partial [Pyramidobacter sp.]|nr:phage tail protein [Pyramidobacter sp.]
LQGHLDAGDHCELILDGRYFGDFVIESLNEEWTRLDNRGGLLAARVSVSLKEYAPWPQA